MFALKMKELNNNIQDACCSAGYHFKSSVADKQRTSKSGLFACCLIFQIMPSIEQVLTSNNGSAGDYFGSAISVNGNLMLIGAYGEDVGSNADQGAAYLFDHTDYSQIYRFVASDGAGNDQFGYTVGYDGVFSVIGSPRSDVSLTDDGAVYIYDDSMVETKLTSPNAANNGYFGYSVAISSNFTLVGAPRDEVAGVVYGYQYSNGVWSLLITYENDETDYSEFGSSVAIGNSHIVVGAIKANSRAGGAYALNTLDGTMLAEMSATDGESYDFFGWSVEVTDDFIFVGAIYTDNDATANTGKVFVFNASSFALTQVLADPTPPSSVEMGWSLSADDDYLAVGTRSGAFNYSGCVHVYKLEETWTLIDTLTNADGVWYDMFGWSIDFDDSKLFIGSTGLEVNGNDDQGVAYVYAFNDDEFNLACSAGNYWNSSSCVECAIGSYQDESGHSSCSECHMGSYATETGQSSCAECGTGKYSNQNGSIVESDCMECAMGTYQDITGQSSCMECGVDSYADSTGSASCTACEDGTCTDGETGASECVTCGNKDSAVQVLSDGAIAGIAVGAVVAFSSIFGIVFCACRKNAKTASEEKNDDKAILVSTDKDDKYKVVELPKLNEGW